MLYNISEILLKIIDIIVLIVAAMFCFRVVYAVLGFFTTRKFKPAKEMHKYAILVAARNEESVIGNLIHSVKSQDYPSELVTIFVVADNCTDNTAEIARKSGAICYERTDALHRTKGYALQFLVECIRRDYGIDAFEGYFIFEDYESWADFRDNGNWKMENTEAYIEESFFENNNLVVAITTHASSGYSLYFLPFG